MGLEVLKLSGERVLRTYVGGKLIEELHGEKEVHFVVNVEGTPKYEYIKADSLCLRQIFINLLSNSILLFL